MPGLLLVGVAVCARTAHTPKKIERRRVFRAPLYCARDSFHFGEPLVRVATRRFTFVPKRSLSAERNSLVPKHQAKELGQLLNHFKVEGGCPTRLDEKRAFRRSGVGGLRGQRMDNTIRYTYINDVRVSAPMHRRFVYPARRSHFNEKPTFQASGRRNVCARAAYSGSQLADSVSDNCLLLTLCITLFRMSDESGTGSSAQRSPVSSIGISRDAHFKRQ